MKEWFREYGLSVASFVTCIALMFYMQISDRQRLEDRRALEAEFREIQERQMEIREKQEKISTKQENIRSNQEWLERMISLISSNQELSKQWMEFIFENSTAR